MQSRYPAGRVQLKPGLPLKDGVAVARVIDDTQSIGVSLVRGARTRFGDELALLMN